MSKEALSAQLLSYNIRRLRRLHKMSQMDLAKKADLSVAFVNAIENKQKWVSAKTIDKIAIALDAKTHELFLPFDNAEISLHIVESHHHLMDELRELVNNYEIKKSK